MESKMVSGCLVDILFATKESSLKISGYNGNIYRFIDGIRDDDGVA